MRPPNQSKIGAVYGIHSVEIESDKILAHNTTKNARDVELEELEGPLGRLLRTSIWAQELSSQQIKRVTADVIARRLRAGEVVYCKGEPIDNWIGVIDGFVKISSDAPDGKSVTFTVVTDGGWFGEGSLLKSEFVKHDAVALRDTVIALMPRATFHWLLQHNIPFNRFLLNQSNERLEQSIAMVECDRLLGRNARVARCLALLFNPYLNPGIQPHIPISQEEIGHLSGICRQRVNETLHVLEKTGLLRVEYGGITVIDPAGLSRLSE